MIIVVDEGPIHIQKDDFSRHKAPFLLVFDTKSIDFSHSKIALFIRVYSYQILLYNFLNPLSYEIMRNADIIL